MRRHITIIGYAIAVNVLTLVVLTNMLTSSVMLYCLKRKR